MPFKSIEDAYEAMTTAEPKDVAQIKGWIVQQH